MKTELTSKAVQDIFSKCLYKEEDIPEDGIPENAVMAEVVMMTVGFDPDRLSEHSSTVRELVEQLPETFEEGWSFLNACMTRDGRQWGEHRDVDSLLALGLATGDLKMCLPKAMWSMLPGGLPYFQITPLVSDPA